MTKKSFFYATFIMSIAFLFHAFHSPSTAHAGFFDRVKDIYTAPEKLDEVREEYDNLLNSIEQQQAELNATRQEAIDSAMRYEEEQRKWFEQNEAYRQQNQMLAARNQELTQRLANLETEQENRKALIHKVILITSSIIGLILIYFISMRLLRITIWRREKRAL